jgi:hypothetical protein
MDVQPTPPSGTQIGRDVKVEDGDFVGRDKIINARIDRETLAELAKFVEPAPKRELPWLLPYKVNRRAQEDRLLEIFSGYQSQAPRPVVVLMHGNDKQARDTFLERLSAEFLPRILKINLSGKAIWRIRLPWPTHIKNTGDLQMKFIQSLSDEILTSLSGTTAELQAVLARHDGPAVIETSLLTEDWMRHKKGILNTILGFWNNWPDLDAGQILFVFVYITHKMPEVSWFKQRLYEIHRQQIHVQLEQCMFQQYGKVIGGVLPELADISRSDVENWANREAKEYLAGNVQAVMPHIRRLFTHTEQLPMETLAEQLKLILISSADI